MKWKRLLLSQHFALKTVLLAFISVATYSGLCEKTGKI
jgi:hypothetical protein